MKSKIKLVVKGILYVLIVHCLSIINIILYSRGMLSDITPYSRDLIVILIQLAIFNVVAPIYFWIKGDTKTPWLYTLTTVVMHLILIFLVDYIIRSGSYNYDFKFMTSIWAAFILTPFFVCIILLDIAKTLWEKLVSKKKSQQNDVSSNEEIN